MTCLLSIAGFTMEDITARRAIKSVNTHGPSIESVITSADYSDVNNGSELIKKFKVFFGVKTNVEEIKASVTKTEFIDKLRAVTKNKFHNRNIEPVTIWDFEGQDVFYSTHPIFLTYRAVYMLVLDGSRTLNDPCKYKQFIPGIVGAKTQKGKTNIAVL